MSPVRPWVWLWVGTPLLVIDASILIRYPNNTGAVVGIVLGCACLCVAYTLHRVGRS